MTVGLFIDEENRLVALKFRRSGFNQYLYDSPYRTDGSSCKNCFSFDWFFTSQSLFIWAISLHIWKWTFVKSSLSKHKTWQMAKSDCVCYSWWEFSSAWHLIVSVNVIRTLALSWSEKEWLCRQNACKLCA